MFEALAGDGHVERPQSFDSDRFAFLQGLLDVVGQVGQDVEYIAFAHSLTAAHTLGQLFGCHSAAHLQRALYGIIQFFETFLRAENLLSDQINHSHGFFIINKVMALLPYVSFLLCTRWHLVQYNMRSYVTKVRKIREKSKCLRVEMFPLAIRIEACFNGGWGSKFFLVKNSLRYVPVDFICILRHNFSILLVMRNLWIVLGMLLAISMQAQTGIMT